MARATLNVTGVPAGTQTVYADYYGDTTYNFLEGTYSSDRQRGEGEHVDLGQRQPECIDRRTERYDHRHGDRRKQL